MAVPPNAELQLPIPLSTPIWNGQTLVTRHRTSYYLFFVSFYSWHLLLLGPEPRVSSFLHHTLLGPLSGSFVLFLSIYLFFLGSQKSNIRVQVWNWRLKTWRKAVFVPVLVSTPRHWQFCFLMLVQLFPLEKLSSSTVILVFLFDGSFRSPAFR